jgi:hypothetical protein
MIYDQQRAKLCKKMIERCDEAYLAIKRCENAGSVVVYDKSGDPVVELQGDDAKLAVAKIKGEYEQTLENMVWRIKRDFGIDLQV